MYKVFINESVIIFTNNQEIENKSIPFLKFNFFDVNMIDLTYQLIKNDTKLEAIYFVIEDVENAFLEFKNHFKLIKAAGGWVRNNENKSLFIYRLDKWDLPKGKIEVGEDNKTAAIREVEEECGINSLEITGQLPDTFHIYEFKGQVILKQTFWFDMITEFNGKLTPQIEEDITEVVWIDDEELKTKVLKNTYASIDELVA
jgi:8-oxo-dGTP pyrophosphatase MutT (NUDIX family)